MAKAFKCDRCGKFFDDTNNSCVNEFNIGKVRYRILIENVNSNSSYLDICNECKETFIEWFNFWKAELD